MRTRLVLLPTLSLLAPLAAQAGKPKSPFDALVNADGTRAFGSGLQLGVGTSGGGFIGVVGIQPSMADAALNVATSLASAPTTCPSTSSCTARNDRGPAAEED
jgi:hypothetical protein